MLFPSVNNRKSWLSFLLFMVVCFNLYFHFSFQGSLKDRAQWLDSLFGKILEPIQYGFHSAGQWTSQGLSSFQRLMKAEQENRRLYSELDKEKLQLAAFKELQMENERLKSMLGFRESEGLQFLAANVIGRDVSLYFRSIEINRGRDDGVDDYYPVVSSAGAVGRVLSAGKRSSRVLLVNDVNSRLDAIVQRSRTRSIVGGSSEGELNLRFLPRRFDIREGDDLVTSGLGDRSMPGYFPGGFKVGSVVGLAKDPNLVLEEAVLESSVDFDSLEDVFVVRPPAPRKS